MLSANQIEGIGSRVDVRSSLVGRIATIADGVVGRHGKRRHATTNAIIGSLVQAGGVSGNRVTVAAQIGAGNSNACRFAGSGPIRKNMVENPAEAGVELVDSTRRKHVGFGKS